MKTVIENLHADLANMECREQYAREQSAYHTKEADGYSAKAIELRRAIAVLEKANG